MLFSHNVIRIYDNVPEHVFAFAYSARKNAYIHRLSLVEPSYFVLRIMILPWNRSLTEKNVENTLRIQKEKLLGNVQVMFLLLLFCCVCESEKYKTIIIRRGKNKLSGEIRVM